MNESSLQQSNGKITKQQGNDKTIKQWQIFDVTKSSQERGKTSKTLNLKLGYAYNYVYLNL